MGSFSPMLEQVVSWTAVWIAFPLLAGSGLALISMTSPEVALGKAFFTTQELSFSGRVYVYHAGSVSLADLAELDTAFRDSGAYAQFRGMNYVMAAWQSIRLGDAKAPPKYEVRDGVIALVPKGQ